MFFSNNLSILSYLLVATAAVVAVSNDLHQLQVNRPKDLLDVLHASRRQSGKRDLSSLFRRQTDTGTLADVLNNATAIETPVLADSFTISIVDLTGDFSLAYDPVGNFYLDSASMRDTYPFTVLDGKVYGGSGDKVMFWYPDELAATGVSRFRQADLDKVPVGTEMINLLPFGDGPVYLMPVGLTQEKVLTPVYCTYKGVGSRIFLTDNIDKGITALMDPANQVIITGGVITWCGPVAFPTDMPSL